MLVQNRISEEVIAEVRDECGSDYDVPSILEATVDSKADVKALKVAIKAMKPRLSEYLFDALRAECRDIADELKWTGTNKKSQILVQKKISEYLVDEVRDECGADYEIPSVLEATVDSKTDVKALKDAIKAMKPRLSEYLFEALQEECREIKDDFKWIGTKQGGYIMRINEWAETFHDEFLTIKKYEGANISGHLSRQVVMVHGKVRSERTLKQLIKYVKSKDPPFKMLVDVTIGPKYRPSGL